ncbi:hypothetical protein LCGC14_1496820 [marine sediment metagenome]|uniref:Uncharacterized protein n=1 Tax=marine sediment metagenome TaxID=412755 RepID=A0A0F9J5U0_9ZZZZ
MIYLVPTTLFSLPGKALIWFWNLPIIARALERVLGSSRDMPGAIVFSYREPGTGTRYKSPLESQAGNQTRVVSLRPPSPREWLRVTENDWEPT